MRVAKLECDNCRKQVDAEEVVGWLRVFTVVGNEEAMEALAARMEAGEKPVDQGDFCTLRCLGEWAFAQELLRGMDEAVDEA